MRADETEQNVTLTVQELEAAHLASWDLGPGYPQLPVPDFVKKIYLDDQIEELSLHFAPFWTPDKQACVDDDLERSVRRFIGIERNRYYSMRATFSGSVALDRSLSAIVREARAEGARGIDVITTTPSIDIMRLILEERKEIRPRFVRSRCNGVFAALDEDAVLGEVRATVSASKGRKVVLLLTSPENPTGEYWEEGALSRIATVCQDMSVSMLVDHTFITAGVHSPRIPCIWDVAPDGLSWMAVWDTGKTFGLNEDKLGFVFTSNENVASVLDEALAVLQFGVARRQKLFFTELMRQAIFYDYLAGLRTICRSNLDLLQDVSDATGLLPRRPLAGSLALIDCAAIGRSDEYIREKLLQAQVGVVAGSVFFHERWIPRNFIRVALARAPGQFADAIDRLVSDLTKLKV